MSEKQSAEMPKLQSRPYCPPCNKVGLAHCAYPEECGEVIYPQDYVEKLEKRIAALDAIRKESIKALERRIARHTACTFELRRNNVDGLCNDCKEDFNLLARAREFDKE